MATSGFYVDKDVFAETKRLKRIASRKAPSATTIRFSYSIGSMGYDEAIDNLLKFGHFNTAAEADSYLFADSYTF